MNVLEVLGIAIIGYFVFVGLWLTKIEDYLQIEQSGANQGGSSGE